MGCTNSDVGGADFDGDGSVDIVDCAPSDPAIHPCASEVCDDELDNDCDSWTDCADNDCLVLADCAGDDDDSGGVDQDGDGIPDGEDNCPNTAIAGQEDQDGDQVPGTEPGLGDSFGGDACDTCTDLDGDGFGAGLDAETCPVDTCPGSDDADGTTPGDDDGPGTTILPSTRSASRRRGPPDRTSRSARSAAVTQGLGQAAYRSDKRPCLETTVVVRASDLVDVIADGASVPQDYPAEFTVCGRGSWPSVLG